MKKNLVIILIFISFYAKAQLLVPFAGFKKTGISVEAGIGGDMMSGESIHGILSATTTFRLGSYFAARHSFNYGTKSKHEEINTLNSSRQLIEVSFHPIGYNSKASFARFGIYAGFDNGVRNYKFEGLSQIDQETGAAIHQFSGTGIDDYQTNYNKSVFQFAIPTYRAGISLFAFNRSEKQFDANKMYQDRTGLAANIYVFYSFSPNLGNQVVTGTQSNYNIDVPISYYISDGLSVKKNGIAFGMQILTHQFFGLKMEIGSRPNIYRTFIFGEKTRGFEKAAYFHLGLNLRLI